ncbi:MAG: VWA domain-containing protein [Deltaproteobacteria bacterium]|nr:VWA domain-containing protein [Deltaproteobacteria bacterium]
MHLFYIWALRRKTRHASAFGLSIPKDGRRNIFFSISLFFVVIAMAGPQFGTEDVVVGRKKVDVVIAIDASLSMLARDDNKSRLDIAKRISSNLIESIGEARVGLIAFAAKPVIMSPLTTDINIVKTFLDRLDTGMFWNQGTSIKLALDEGVNIFKKSEGRKKIILLLTDGDDPDASHYELTDNIARQGIKIYTIGIGSKKGAQVPMFSKEGIFMGYKKDAEGRAVITRLNEDALKDIASRTGGVYYRQDFSLDSFLQELLIGAEIEKTSEKVMRYRDVFQFSLGMAIIFLVLEKLLSFAKVQRIRYYDNIYYLKSGGVYGTYRK